MANEKTPKTGKETPEVPAKVPPKSYVVAFSGITDKTGNLRLKGETVSADELPDPEFQLSLGAIAEIVEAAADQSQGETK
jgi:hypothetical protein